MDFASSRGRADGGGGRPLLAPTRACFVGSAGDEERCSDWADGRPPPDIR